MRCYCDRLTRSRVPTSTLWLVNALERAEAVDAYLASVDESVLDEDSIECPACGETLEFDFDEDDDEEDDD